jgi:hypothetical protein
MAVLRKRPLKAARHLTGAKVLAAPLYGVGPTTGLALTCWLALPILFAGAAGSLPVLIRAASAIFP